VIFILVMATVLAVLHGPSLAALFCGFVVVTQRHTLRTWRGRIVLATAVLSVMAYVAGLAPPTRWVDAAAGPLQAFDARQSAMILTALGVETVVDGASLHFPRFTLVITEACSGIRSLVTLLALASVWAALGLTQRFAWLLVIMAVPVAFATNIARTVVLGLIGHWWGVAAARGLWHDLTGWLMFALGFGLLAGLYQLMVYKRVRLQTA
jgi:exosortase